MDPFRRNVLAPSRAGRLAPLLSAALIVLLQFGPAAANCSADCDSDYYSCIRAYNERDCATAHSICQNRCAGERFGAIAYSEGSGAYGYSYDMGSRNAADRRAERECRRRSGSAGDCRVLVWFQGACGALAKDRRGPYGSAWGYTAQEAEAKAMQICRNHGGTDCRVQEIVCSEQR